MKDNSKAGLILMGIYGVAGVVTGLMFSKAQYHKGQADAYEDITNDLNKVIEETEEMLNKKAEESE